MRTAAERPALAVAVPVAVRLLRGLDPGGDATLTSAEFVSGMRFLIDAASRLVPPLLTELSKEPKRLRALFTASDLNHDGILDVNEWILMLQLQPGLLPAISTSSDTPYRNGLVRALRETMRAAAERKQREVYRAGAGSPDEVGGALNLADGLAPEVEDEASRAAREAEAQRRAALNGERARKMVEAAHKKQDQKKASKSGRRRGRSRTKHRA